MFLNFGHLTHSMRLVFELEKELAKEPEKIQLVQALTLNRDKPLMGLRGKHGLYGSPEWWENIRRAFKEPSGAAGWWRRLTNTGIKVQVVSGTIERTYFAGQDARWGDQINSFTLTLHDGSSLDESIYAHSKADAKLFVSGAQVLIAYVFDELKRQPSHDGGVNYVKTVLEMAVSTKLSKS